MHAYFNFNLRYTFSNNIKSGETSRVGSPLVPEKQRTIIRAYLNVFIISFMASAPLISIIVPAYNIELYIRQCVESVLSQLTPSFELIVVDDGSTDRTAQILNTLQELDNRLIVINKTNGGVSTARNEGLKIATGKYVMFIDGDDWLKDDCLLKVSEVIKEYHPDVICYGELKGDKNNMFKPAILPHRQGLYNKREIEKEIYPFLIHGKDGSYFTPSLIEKCFKKELCEKYMLVNKDATIGEDGATIIPCVYHADSLYLMDECLYYYRYNDTSATKGRKVFNWVYPEIINKHIEHNVEISTSDFAEQLKRKIVHDVFNVVVTRFYQGISYKEIISDIKYNLSRPYYQYAIQNASFKGSLAHTLMIFSLKYSWYVLIYLYSRVK